MDDDVVCQIYMIRATHVSHVPWLIFHMCRDSLSNHIWMTMWCVKYTWFAPRMFGMCHDSFTICAVTHYPYVHHIWMTMWCVKYRCIAPRMFRLCHDSLSMCAMTHFPYVPWLVFHDCCTHFPARLNVVVGCTMWVTAHMCKNKCGRGMYYSTSSDPRLTWWSWDVLCAIDI